ncbi:Transmembrane protein 147 [Xyrichtys novacula]|nr:Transmembrane protein 147 [Xyrichtys novacula]
MRGRDSFLLTLCFLLTAALCLETSDIKMVVVLRTIARPWSKAKLFCQTHHIDLASEDRVRANAEWVASYDTEEVWIDDHEDTWDYQFWRRVTPRQDGEDIESNTSPAQRNPDEQVCEFFDTNSKTVRSRECSQQHRFVCLGDNLVLVKKNKTWEDALQHCKDLETECDEHSNRLCKLGFTLLTLQQSDHDYVRKRMKHSDIEEVWTGLRFLEGHWFWADGQELSDEGNQFPPKISSDAFQGRAKATSGRHSTGARPSVFFKREPRPDIMTLFHFGNCFALAYFPYFITYKCSGLSEYNAFWRCVQAGATYLFVQLCKMLFLATFFPTWEGGAGVYDFVGEFMKATVDLADLLGLHLVMSRNAGKGEYKIMVAAMGWATAELVMSRCLPLWVGARGIEFDWKYIQMSFDSNISLVHYIAMAAVVWMFTRYDLPKSFRLPVTVLLALCVYKAFLMELFVHVFLLGSWTVLLVKAVLTGAISLCSLFLFVTLVHSN